MKTHSFARNVLSGLWLSVPAALLILAGFADGTEPTSWTLWRIAELLGLPWNEILLRLLVSLSQGVVNLWFPSVNWHNLGVVTLGLIPCGLLGAHINGIIVMLIVRKLGRSRHKSSTAIG